LTGGRWNSGGRADENAAAKKIPQTNRRERESIVKTGGHSGWQPGQRGKKEKPNKFALQETWGTLKGRRLQPRHGYPKGGKKKSKTPRKGREFDYGPGGHEKMGRYGKNP